MDHITLEKNNSDIEHLLHSYENCLKNLESGKETMLSQTLPTIIQKRISEKLISGELNQEQAKDFLEKIQSLAKEMGSDVSIQIMNLDAFNKLTNNDSNNHNDSSDQNNNDVDNQEQDNKDEHYHLAYLTPEEIFRMHISSASLTGAQKFFTQLCKAHHLKSKDMEAAKILFDFILAAQKNISSSVDYDDFCSSLIFSNSIDLFNKDSSKTDAIQDLGLTHFFDQLHLDDALDNDDNDGIETLYFSDKKSMDEYIQNKYLNVNSDHVSSGTIVFESEQERDEYIKNKYQVVELPEENSEDDFITFNTNDFEEIDNINDIIDLHNSIAESIISVFGLNEEVKQLLLDSQTNVVPSSDIADTYHILENAIFDGVIPTDKQVQLQSILKSSKHKLAYILKEQTTLHNIVQGLISKDANLFFAGTDSYVQEYLINENKQFDLDSLSLNDIITLFVSDYFVTVQNPKSPLASMFIEFFFDHYDETIFKLFIERYKIPKNITIRVVNEEKPKTEYFLPLLEFAIFINNYHVADSLISQGFGLESFQAKVIENDVVYNYNYSPFANLSLFNESNLIYLIDHDFISADVHLSYPEVIDDKSVSVTNNVFFYLAYEQFNEAILRLYEKTCSLNSEFTTKQLKTYRKTDLLSYYLMFAHRNNAYNFDMNVLNIFLTENYKIELHSGSNIDVIKVLKGYENLDSLVDVIHYLSDIFPESLKEKSKVDLSKLKRKDNELIQWFDKNKLETHFKRIEKERDSANKEYIKHMLSNNSHLKKNLIIEDEGFFDTLQKQFPNFEEVINFYKAQFRLKKLSGKTRIAPILLLGDPGIGKTYFAKKLAENLKTGYNFVDMASITSNWVLTGNNGTWKSAKQGKILEAMMNSQTINPVFLMDEIEKARGGEYDPTMSLYQLLEEVNAKSFTDEFVDFSFDASGIIYIACANTLGNLSEPLQTRFHIINVPKPNDEQLNSIIHNIYDEATKDAHIFSTVLSSEIMTLLKKETLRSIKVMIDKAVGSSLLEVTPSEIDQLVEKDEKITLNIKHFQSPNKKKDMGF